MTGKLHNFNLHFIRAQLHSGQTLTEIHDIYTESSKTSKTDLQEEKGVLNAKCGRKDWIGGSSGLDIKGVTILKLTCLVESTECGKT